MTAEIHPFRIAIDEATLDDLRVRLGMTRWPDKETVQDWSQGVPLAHLRFLCDYWRDGYDWRRCETMLNRFGLFRTTIDGVEICFIHKRSPNAEAMPLLMTHGWPGSVIEFAKVIDPLVDPVTYGGKPEDAFHIIAPCLPGYGFSGKPSTTGWGVSKIAEIWIELMRRLGYERYGAQGGDWGSAVSMSMAMAAPPALVGIHLNMVIGSPAPDDMENLTDAEQAALASVEYYNSWGNGYATQQSTRPQTLGYGLADSPIGQAAWIYEKFYEWTDCDGDPRNVLGIDEMLDNIMLYWLPGSGASSARLYWESFRHFPFEPTQVPVACSIFPREIFTSSRRWAERNFKNLIYWNELEKGGHFPAFEQPAAFVRELRNGFRSLR